ncbi:MAG: ABC transporter substrate-binding protein, partial [Roseburia sp.]|nr:ABC transporter substrate-binding protein [Roseburia sp.]
SLLLATVCVLSAAILSGCREKTGTTEFETVPVLQDTRDTAEKMNTFVTLNGNSVTYNMNTRKIVALSGAGDLVAFGIKPLAVIADDTTMAAYPAFFEGVDSPNYTQPFNAEEIMSYGPELILVYQMMDDDSIKELEKIAPVIPLYRESFDFEERLGYIGDIFGLQDNAKTLIDYAKDTQEKAIARLQELNLSGKTVSVFYYLEGVSIPPTDYWYFNKIIYDYMGMKRTAAADEFLNDPTNNPFTPISSEVLRNYEGDIVIYVDLAVTGGVPAVPDVLNANPGWQSLKAYQNGTVGAIDAMLYAEKDVLYLQAQYSSLISAFEKSMPQE